jgi:hypothetical protein
MLLHILSGKEDILDVYDWYWMIRCISSCPLDYELKFMLLFTIEFRSK